MIEKTKAKLGQGKRAAASGKENTKSKAEKKPYNLAEAMLSQVNSCTFLSENMTDAQQKEAHRLTQDLILALKPTTVREFRMAARAIAFENASLGALQRAAIEPSSSAAAAYCKYADKFGDRSDRMLSDLERLQEINAAIRAAKAVSKKAKSAGKTEAAPVVPTSADAHSDHSAARVHPKLEEDAAAVVRLVRRTAV